MRRFRGKEDKAEINGIIKKVLLLAAPVLILLILFYPYGKLNSEVIVKWLGCGCPQIDASGNINTSVFNANDFTSLFWHGSALLLTALSAALSFKLRKEHLGLWLLYVAVMLIVTLSIAALFTQKMMWK